MRALIFAAALLAAPACVGSRAGAEPVDYHIDFQHSQIMFSIDRFGFNHVIGRFDGRIDAQGRQIVALDPNSTSVITGEIMLDQTTPARSSVQATVQMAGLTSGDLQRDNIIKGDHWLNVAQYPTMTFRSTSVQMTDATHARVAGDLTLMGQTHPFALAVTLNKIGPAPDGAQAAGFTATGTLHRSQWGLTIATGLIGDDVNITIEALGALPHAPATSVTRPPAHN